MLHWQKSDFNEDANDCLWEPVGAWEEEPEVLDFTEHTNMILFLNDQLNGLIIRAEDRMKKQADQVPGLHPYYGERYEYAKEILYQVQDGVMLDGHANDTFYWLNVLACNFNEALYGLDLHIDVNPNWQPEQQPTSEPGHQRGQITRIEEVQP